MRCAPIVVAFAAVAAATAVAGPLAAQQATGAASTLMRRDDLLALESRLDRALQSPAYSERLKARTRAELDQARARLQNGDFQVGDRISVLVQGESTLTDTFTVGPGREITMRPLGAIPLKGVLHAELESYLTQWIGRYVRNPKVQARSMLRIAIGGAVARPGFYSVPAEGLLSDALMAAGGPAPNAAVEQTHVERAGKNVLAGSAFRAAVAAGQTLDKLDVRAGDRIVVPARGVGLGGPETAVRTLGYILSLPLTVFAITRLF